jgi:aspartate racemase
MEKVLGIIGGMGPEATVDLLRKIIEATPAKRDQEHLRVLVDCNPKIPSRPAALLKGGPDPTPLLQQTARGLERAGAELLLVACNTAHLFHDRIAAAVRIPVLHMVDEAVAEAVRRHPGVRAAGILAGGATVCLRLYQDRLEARAIRAIIPSEQDQERVVSVIYAVKAGDKGPAVRARIREVAERLAQAGAELLFAGCTELPLVLEDGDVSVPVLDPTQILAQAAVRLARGTSEPARARPGGSAA